MKNFVDTENRRDFEGKGERLRYVFGTDIFYNIFICVIVYPLIPPTRLISDYAVLVPKFT